MRQDVRAMRWTFLTNHAHVLLCLARSPELRLRDVALLVGVTERAVQRIIADLEEAGYLTRHRHGRQNHYEIEQDLPLRHAVESHQTVRALIGMAAPATLRRRPAVQVAAAAPTTPVAVTRGKRAAPRTPR